MELRPAPWPSRVLLVLALLCFVLAAFGVTVGVALTPLGLSFFAASFLL